MNIAAILASLGGLAAKAAPLTGGGLAQVLMLGGMLQRGTDWKQVLATQGEAFVRAEVQDLWSKKLAKDAPNVASDMEGEGWSLTKALEPGFQAAQHIDVNAIHKAADLAKAEGPHVGAAWLISRDSLYAALRDSGIPGGAARDAWRDASDDKIFDLIKPHVTTTSTVGEIVAATFAALPPLTL